MEGINGIEIIVNEVLQSLGTWLKVPMLAMTALGYEEFFILLLPTLYWCFDPMVGLRVGMVLLLGNVFNTFLKFLFHNTRPYWFSETVKALSFETSFGLPSGHAQISATVWGWLAVEVKKRWFTITAVIVIFLIGFSRLYLGVHFLSDVTLGWLLGGLLVWAFASWYPKVGQWLNQKSLLEKVGIIAASTAVMILLVLGARWVVGPWEMPAAWAGRAGEVDPFSLDGIFTVSGTWMGMLMGYVWLTEKKGHFLAGDGGWRRLARLLIGLLGIFILYFGLGQVFPRDANFVGYALRFVRYTVIGLWVSMLAPLSFERLKLLNFEERSS
jgi:membrane-associated phospholipid phosphatase